MNFSSQKTMPLPSHLVRLLNEAFCLFPHKSLGQRSCYNYQIITNAYWINLIKGLK